MEPRGIRIIPFLQGKLTRRGKLSEPDIDDILERWLERHPEFKGRERGIPHLLGPSYPPRGHQDRVG
ncbi:MAG: hypothetical protein JO034_08865 [Singulisphaera sp.]|jgi:hypothetical protein|nr:hypothetical protein [Singulisphaera sp.]